MAGVHHRARRRRPVLRPVLRPALVALAAVVGLIALPAGWGVTHAAFSAVTTNPANRLTADRLAAPTGLSAAQTCAAATPIAFRASYTTTGTDSLTLLVPAATQAGDLLLAQVTYTYTTATFTPAPGWTLVTRDSASTVLTSAVFTKIAVAGEPSATFRVPNGTGTSFLGGLAAYSGVSGTNPVEAAAGISGNGTGSTYPTVTTTTANTQLLRLHANNTESYPAPAGTTQRWRVGTGRGITLADEPFVGPGTSPARTFTSPTGTSGWGIAQTVALRLGPGTPSAVLTWTASSSSWADGYELERLVGGTLQAGRSVTPVSAVTTTDGPLVNGTTYTYRLTTTRGSWRSAAVAVPFTPAC